MSKPIPPLFSPDRLRAAASAPHEYHCESCGDLMATREGLSFTMASEAVLPHTCVKIRPTPTDYGPPIRAEQRDRMLAENKRITVTPHALPATISIDDLVLS